MATYNVYEIYLDQDGNIFLDDGWFLDEDSKLETIIYDMYLSSITVTETRTETIEVDIQVYEQEIVGVDILPLFPQKFRTADIVTEFVDVANGFIGLWLGQIKTLEELVDPYRVNIDYIRYLSNLINLELIQDDDTTLTDLRKQLRQAIELYKIKGTYNSLISKAYTLGLKINIYDMYTNDYSSFTEAVWTATDEGENPTGIPASYYKSPHFTIETEIVTVYSGTSDYLWQESLYTALNSAVELISPVYTVPHYRLLLQCITDESGEVWEAEGEVKTKVMADWETTLLYLDQDVLPVSSGSAASSGATQLWHLDEGEYLDASLDSFLNSITRWKIGEGNKGVSPGDSGFSGLANVVAEGDVDTINILADRTEFIFTVPASLVSTVGLSELGLYLSNNTTIEVASTFPNIYKHSEVELKVIVTVYRT